MKPVTSIFLSSLLSGLAVLSSPVAAAQYSVAAIGPLNPTGINNLGQVSGWVNSPVGPQASLYNGTTWTVIGSPAGRSFANGINDAGHLVGTFGNDEERAFNFNGTAFSELTPGASRGSAINNAGQMVGTTVGADGSERGFIYGSNGVTDLSAGAPPGTNSEALALNSHGQVVGAMWDGEGGQKHAFSYVNGVMTDLSGGMGGFSTATGVNDSGQIIMTVDLGGPGTRNSYLYVNGVMTNLGSLGVSDTYAADINGAGIVVGTGATADFGGTSGFIWRDGVMTDLNALINPDSGWTIVSAAGINDRNQIAAFGCRDGDCQGLLLDVLAVPEPGTTIMLGAGLALVLHTVRRRRTAAA